MAESSSYRDSIQFYERMSHFQGELKNYDSQQFQLEKEFERLWTQEGVNASVGFEPKTTTFEQLGHLSDKSKLPPNPTNLSRNYSGPNVDENRRRARNQAILDKLQELETNTSIFAARSEQLRMMRVS